MIGGMEEEDKYEGWKRRRNDGRGGGGREIEGRKEEKE